MSPTPCRPSELPAFEQIPYGVLGAAEHDPPISVTEGEDVRPGGDTRFREQTDGELDQTLVVDTEFCRFPKHGTSVAPSHS